MKEGTIREDNSGQEWVCCPYCGKKTLLLRDDTKIKNLPVKCKGSNCKKVFLVNV